MMLGEIFPRRALTALALLSLLLTACATVPTIDHESIEMERERGFVDPRAGYNGTHDAAIGRRFEKGYSLLLTGRNLEAERAFADILKRDSSYRPAILGLSRLAFTSMDFDRAERLAQQAREGVEGYLAADVYLAEIALAQGNRAEALRRYEIVLRYPNLPPNVREKAEQLRREMFDELLARASSQDPDKAVATLREALAISNTWGARTQLVTHLITLKRFEEAFTELQPLINSSDVERDEVQALVAEIEVHRGRFEDAIRRLERLARRNQERYGPRLNEVKQLWVERNLPIQYRKAVESSAIDRADLAVLIYWNLPAVRFATRVGAPPIAVDIAEVPGRDELVRALALGLYSVDPITREVNPYRTVSRTALARILARVASLRGTPACAANVQAEGEQRRADATLEACGISIPPPATPEEEGVPGRAVVPLLQKIDAILGR